MNNMKYQIFVYDNLNHKWTRVSIPFSEDFALMQVRSYSRAENRMNELVREGYDVIIREVN